MRGKVWINHHCPNKEYLVFIKEELEAHNLYIFEQAITDSDRIANILPFISNNICTEQNPMLYSTQPKQTIRKYFSCASDAAFADDRATRRSTGGYLFQLFGGPIDWHSTKQKTVTTSSTEAELLALTYATKETIWWQRFFQNIHFDPGHDLTISCDNQQTTRLMTKDAPKLTTKLRHVDIHQHWMRQEVQEGRIL
jgi:hypothetical protein